MKKFVAIIAAMIMALSCTMALADETIIVATNPEYPPFEYVEGEATAADLADAMVEKADGIGAAQAMVNPQGQELIMFMTADGSNLGYCVLDGQGYMISFIFSRLDGQPISAETDAVRRKELSEKLNACLLKSRR